MDIRKVEDYAIYSDKRFSKNNMIDEEKALTFTLTLKPGQIVPSHTHGESGLIIYVIEGNGILIVDENQKMVKSGDVIYCHGREVFSLKNESDENILCLGVLTK